MFLPWVLCGVLFVAVMGLCLKIHFLHQSMDEICAELEEHLSQETNTLISISSTDRHSKHLAAGLNKQLRLLRRQRWKYLNGDRELKEAVTNISHDLRTPLTAIYGYLGLLEKEEKSQSAARYLSLIENRAQALKQLTEELFRYSVITSAPEKLHLEAVNLNGALEESVAAYYASLNERGITPAINLPEKRIVRQLDHAAVSRIFCNILNNALKYSDGDLEIVLRENGEILFSNAASGLDEVRTGKLFNRFYTVEAAQNATGLGLAISKTLIEQMSGTITAQYTNNRLVIRILFSDAGSH